MHPMLNIAVRAARTADNLITKYYETSNNIEIRQQSNDGFVTRLNKFPKTVIIETIRKSYPHHIFITESTNDKGTNHDIQWIINSPESSINFIKRLPYFAISIAVRIKGRTEIAVVYDPVHNELFSAVRGQGAQMNNYRLRGSNTSSLDRAILATNFPVKEKKYASVYMNILSKLFTQCTDFRCTGSVSLNLAYLAAGRIDGCFEIGLKLWDFAAGELIAREAGMIICDFIGSHNYPVTGNIVVGNPRITKAIVAHVRNELNKTPKK